MLSSHILSNEQWKKGLAYQNSPCPNLVKRERSAIDARTDARADAAAAAAAGGDRLKCY